MHISEALQRPGMCFIGIKSANRTAHMNEIRGLLAEYGIEIAQGRSQVRPAVAEILSDGGTARINLPLHFLEVLADLYDELVHMEARVQRYDGMIEAIARADQGRT